MRSGTSSAGFGANNPSETKDQFQILGEISGPGPWRCEYLRWNLKFYFFLNENCYVNSNTTNWLIPYCENWELLNKKYFLLFLGYNESERYTCFVVKHNCRTDLSSMWIFFWGKHPIRPLTGFSSLQVLPCRLQTPGWWLLCLLFLWFQEMWWPSE